MKKTDIAVYGGSLGGVLAAYSAAKCGFRVLLYEPTAWIGGQLTSQAVPPDEHPWIEQTGCTASYRAYRDRVRAYYRSHPDICDELKEREHFCPGGSSVSRLAHPPRLALRLLEEMLSPFRAAGLLEVFCGWELGEVETCGDEIRAITVRKGTEEERVEAKWFLDGTDTGELIARSGCEYRTGAESRAMTGEESAPAEGDPSDMQPVTWVAAVEDRGEGDHAIERPAEYSFFRRLRQPYDDHPVLSMYGPDSATGRAKRFGFYNGERDGDGKPLFGLFSYRRIVRAAHFKRGVPYDVTLLNWPQNDFFLGNLFDCKEARENAYLARQLTLSLLYWLQTEAERADGGRGYPLALNTEALGTEDGLAMAPYIRESRRIVALRTVTEEDVRLGRAFKDSVGVGSYPIDLHITTATHTFLYRPTERFTIPLGALLPVRMKNLLPACKSIGTTHLTNGCYRLHPVEWNVGEVAGLLAAYTLRERVSAREIEEDGSRLVRFQDFLRENGIQLYWD